MACWLVRFTSFDQDVFEAVGLVDVSNFSCNSIFYCECVPKPHLTDALLPILGAVKVHYEFADSRSLCWESRTSAKNPSPF